MGLDTADNRKKPFPIPFVFFSDIMLAFQNIIIKLYNYFSGLYYEKD
tara:strand:- start:1908 stop:2048 length:141 start_codon:yes stop_codon:yes gene_type:complete